jgi:hypothetical protein
VKIGLKQSTEERPRQKLPKNRWQGRDYMILAALSAINRVRYQVRGVQVYRFGVIPFTVLLPVWWLIRFAEAPEVAILEEREFWFIIRLSWHRKGGTFPDAREPPDEIEDPHLARYRSGYAFAGLEPSRVSAKKLTRGRIDMADPIHLH